MSNSFDKYDNKHISTRSSWRASLPFAVFFFKDQKKNDRGYIERDKMSSSQKTPASLWRVNTYSACSFVARERQTFLLAHRHWGTFREEERVWLSDQNSILMTQNLSGIRSEALIGRRSRFIVLAIVYKWQTKDKRPQRSNVNAMNL